jgi:hypothetical protein
VYRKATTASVLPPNWEDKARDAQLRLAFMADQFNIPKERDVNGDQTAVYLVPSSAGARTLAKKGESAIAVIGKGDKRNVTCMLACAADGAMLPAQIICGGKSKQSLPDQQVIDAFKAAEPKGGDITVTPYHWANDSTMIAWVDKILCPNSSRSAAARAKSAS